MASIELEGLWGRNGVTHGQMQGGGASSRLMIGSPSSNDGIRNSGGPASNPTVASGAFDGKSILYW